MAGLYFEEFEEGRVFEHAISRTVTEMDNVLFSTLTMNPQPLHLDEEFAKQTEFGQRLVNSLFTLGLVIGISVGETTLTGIADGLNSHGALRVRTDSGSVAEVTSGEVTGVDRNEVGDRARAPGPTPRTGVGPPDD